ncbi:MAG TPA: ribose-phosphate diphosphokinase, partial [Acidimicrobiales bacterium]|nr:ribose-phosphate diphosphokinase [Acidimicrobiales bacterium]
MELVTKKKLHIVSGRANLPLAVEIAEALGVELGDPNTADFANGEIHCRFGESVRGMDVFIIQSHGASGSMSINDAIFEHLQMVDAARRASAKRITAVMPFYGYGRQDRKAEGREPISAKLIANMFAAAGADRLMSVDLHSGQIQGFFDGPFDHLVAMPVLVEHIEQNMGDDIVVVSPDAGRVKVAERYANALHADLAIVHKRRVKGAKNVVEAKEVVGNVDGRTCVLIDDMIDTGGTLVAAAEQLMEQGAREVCAAATHGVLS